MSVPLIPTVEMTRKAARFLVTMQSALIGLQTIAAASILADVIGARPAALFMVVVAGWQQAVNYYASRAVSESVQQAVARAEAASEVAHTATSELSHATATLVQHNLSTGE